MRRALGVLLLLIAVSIIAWRLRAREASSWQRIAPDLEMRVLSVRASNTLGSEVQIIALRAGAARVKVARGSTLEANEWRQKEKARVCINGGYFDEANKSLGLRIAGGKKFGSLRAANWGVFFIEDGKARVLHTRDFARRYKDLKDVSEAIQCGPRLVVNGRTTDLKPQTARRTALGIQRDGKVVLAISDGVLSFQQWANLWADKNGLNCRDALNLDGGGSTQLSLKTPKKSLEVSGAWPVPDVVLIR